MTNINDQEIMISNNHYKINFLTDVIFRVDYPLPKGSLEIAAEEFYEKIKDDFPVKEPIQTQQLEFKIDNAKEEVKTQKEQITFWRYKSEDGKLIIELQSNALIVITKNYINYPIFEKQIKKVSEIIFELLKISTINRLGLRYINQINLKEPNIFSWKKYLNKNLIQFIDYYEDKKQLRRSMHVSELAYDDETLLNFKYGIFNSLYPNKIITKEFVLDYDCYTQIPFNKEQVMTRTMQYNKIITEYFEKSITDKFKKILDEK